MFKNCVFKPDVNTIKWCKAAGIRAVKTMAQTAIALIGTNALISAVDWKVVASGVAMSCIVSILTSIAGLPEVKAEE
nr:MAG TPA: holin [Caudoviricetes sp.]